MRIEGHWGPAPPALPQEGLVLVSRMPMSDIIRVTWPDGQYRTVIYDRQGDIKLIRLGLYGDRLPKLLNYVWNFYHAYTPIKPGSEPPAPLAVDGIEPGRSAPGPKAVLR